MTAREAFGNGKLLSYFISVLTIGTIIIGGFITLRLWPIQERVSLAEGDIRSLCERTEGLQQDVEKRPTEKELTPVLESIQRQLNSHQKACEDLNKTIVSLEKIMVRIETKIDQ